MYFPYFDSVILLIPLVSNLWSGSAWPNGITVFKSGKYVSAYTIRFVSK
jgi:hypothetical protein